MKSAGDRLVRGWSSSAQDKPHIGRLLLDDLEKDTMSDISGRHDLQQRPGASSLAAVRRALSPEQ
jgi:hypothetical protein